MKSWLKAQHLERILVNMSKNVLYILWAQLSPVQSLSHVRLCDPMDCIMPGFPNLLKLMSIELVMPSNHLILCRPILLPSVFPSITVFFKESVLHISGQSIGVLASASVLPMNIPGWFPLGLTDLISLQSKGLSRVFSSTTVEKHQFLGA